jgi:HEAT repeat protein
VRAALLGFTLLISVFRLPAQQVNTAGRIVTSTVEAMKSQDSTKRSAAFEAATEMLASGKLRPDETDQLKLGIILLLVAENTRINLPDGEKVKPAATKRDCGNGTDNCEGSGEGDEDYYPSLIATVAGFNDERAIPALVGAMPYSSDATGALLKFGEKAVEPILDQLKSRNALLRTSALSMAVTMEGRNASVSPTRIREMLRSALADPVAVVRSHAVKEISCLPDRQDFVPALDKLAKTDPVHWKGREDDGVDGDQFYPVRVDARRALREIKSNEQCVWRRSAG